jgi:ribosomal protein S18 acetylase RimI-like enzyme
MLSGMSEQHPADAHISLTIAESPDDLAEVRKLFHEYADWLGFSLCFQGFDQELATLPGKYAAPEGRLLLARCDREIAGCGALRPLAPGTCEMKRLYVRPQFRGRSLGLRLATHLILEASAIGYELMRLDTIPDKMPEAYRLYRRLGFYEISAYCDNPQPHPCYMELRLSDATSPTTGLAGK